METTAGFSNVLKRALGARGEDRTGADILDIRDFGSRKRAGKKYPLWSVRVNHTPLSVLVYFEDGRWFSELDWLNVFGDGQTPKEAIDSVEMHIAHFKNYYASVSGDELTEYASTLKDRFSQLTQAE